MKKKDPKPEPCAHDWKIYPVPGESPGRVFQCWKCRSIGAKRWGAGKIHPLSCTVVVKREKCKAEAKARMHGRGFRGTFRWACDEHDDHSTTPPAPSIP